MLEAPVAVVRIEGLVVVMVLAMRGGSCFGVMVMIVIAVVIVVRVILVVLPVDVDSAAFVIVRDEVVEGEVKGRDEDRAGKVSPARQACQKTLSPKRGDHRSLYGGSCTADACRGL